MFGRKKADAGITLVANNCEISGDVHFKDQLLVNGTIKGDVYADNATKAQITVSEQGCVQGDIRVPNAVINGRVMGDIHSGEHIELAAKAQITGNVYYNLIEMVMGSRVDGNLVNTQSQDKGKAAYDAASNKPSHPPRASTDAGSAGLTTVNSRPG